MGHVRNPGVDEVPVGRFQQDVARVVTDFGFCTADDAADAESGGDDLEQQAEESQDNQRGGDDRVSEKPYQRFGRTGTGGRSAGGRRGRSESGLVLGCSQCGGPSHGRAFARRYA